MEKLPIVIAFMFAAIVIFYGSVATAVIYTVYKILQHFGIL